MNRELETGLRLLNMPPDTYIWVEVFCTPAKLQVSKADSQFDSVLTFANMIEIKNAHPRHVKKILNKSKSAEEAQNYLAELFSLGEAIPLQNVEFCRIVAMADLEQLPKTAQPCVRLLVLRCLAAISWRFNEDLGAILAGAPSARFPDILWHYLQFLLQAAAKYGTAGYTLICGILKAYDTMFPMIVIQPPRSPVLESLTDLMASALRIIPNGYSDVFLAHGLSALTNEGSFDLARIILIITGFFKKAASKDVVISEDGRDAIGTLTQSFLSAFLSGRAKAETAFFSAGISAIRAELAHNSLPVIKEIVSFFAWTAAQYPLKFLVFPDTVSKPEPKQKSQHKRVILNIDRLDEPSAVLVVDELSQIFEILPELITRVNQTPETVPVFAKCLIDELLKIQGKPSRQVFLCIALVSLSRINENIVTESIGEHWDDLLDNLIFQTPLESLTSRPTALFVMQMRAFLSAFVARMFIRHSSAQKAILFSIDRKIQLGFEPFLPLIETICFTKGSKFPSESIGTKLFSSLFVHLDHPAIYSLMSDISLLAPSEYLISRIFMSGMRKVATTRPETVDLFHRLFKITTGNLTVTVDEKGIVSCSETNNGIHLPDHARQALAFLTSLISLAPSRSDYTLSAKKSAETLAEIFIENPSFVPNEYDDIILVAVTSPLPSKDSTLLAAVLKLIGSILMAKPSVSESMFKSNMPCAQMFSNCLSSVEITDEVMEKMDYILGFRDYIFPEIMSLFLRSTPTNAKFIEKLIQECSQSEITSQTLLTAGVIDWSLKEEHSELAEKLALKVLEVSPSPQAIETVFSLPRPQLLSKLNDLQFENKKIAFSRIAFEGIKVPSYEGDFVLKMTVRVCRLPDRLNYKYVDEALQLPTLLFMIQDNPFKDMVVGKDSLGIFYLREREWFDIYIHAELRELEVIVAGSRTIFPKKVSNKIKIVSKDCILDVGMLTIYQTDTVLYKYDIKTGVNFQGSPSLSDCFTSHSVWSTLSDMFIHGHSDEVSKLLLRVLIPSSDAQDSFSSVGGFQFLSDITLPKETISNLITLFENISSREIRGNMLFYVWLNFTVWSCQTPEVQLNYVNVTLPRLINLFPSEANSVFSRISFLPEVNSAYNSSTLEPSTRDAILSSILKLLPEGNYYYQYLSLLNDYTPRIMIDFSLKKIKDALHDANPEIIEALASVEYFPPFSALLYGSDGSLFVEAIECICMIGKVEPSSMELLSSSILDYSLKVEPSSGLCQKVAQKLFTLTLDVEEGSGALLPLLARFTLPMGLDDLIGKFITTIIKGGHKASGLLHGALWPFWLFSMSITSDMISKYAETLFGVLSYMVSLGKWKPVECLESIESYFELDFSSVRQELIMLILVNWPADNYTGDYWRFVTSVFIYLCFQYNHPVSNSIPQSMTVKRSRDYVKYLDTFRITSADFRIRLDQNTWTDSQIAEQLKNSLSSSLVRDPNASLLLRNGPRLHLFVIYAYLFHIGRRFGDADASLFVESVRKVREAIDMFTLHQAIGIFLSYEKNPPVELVDLFNECNEEEDSYKLQLFHFEDLLERNRLNIFTELRL